MFSPSWIIKQKNELIWILLSNILDFQNQTSFPISSTVQLLKLRHVGNCDSLGGQGEYKANTWVIGKVNKVKQKNLGHSLPLPL